MLKEIESFFREHQLLSYSEISQNRMEPEGSLLRTKEPSIGPYADPDKSSPYHNIFFL
jgi:hypothetical protein